MHSFVQDVRYALRSLTRARSFALAAILTLALGVGANSTIFSVIDSMWFKAFSFPEAERVVQLYGTDVARGIKENDVVPYEYAAWRDSGAFEHLAAYGYGDSAVRLEAEPERMRVTTTTPNLFAVTGARPVLGRVFTAEEDVPGRDGVAVLSHDAWVRRFGADPAVLGRSVTVDGVARTVVGVLARDTQFPPGTQLWVPLALTPEQLAAPDVNLLALGRLKPGLTEAQALQLAKVASKRVEEARPTTNAGWSVTFDDAREDYLGDARIFLVMLSAAVGLVLLIACANVANLLLARATLRQRELAVRSALGASRGRLVRQMLTEGLLLAAAGSALGLLLARWGVDVIVRIIPPERAAAIPGWSAAAVDGRAVVFTLALTLLTTLVFGLLPALRASRVDPQKALKQVGSSGDPASGRLRGALVVAEVALSVVLLTCAALLLQSLVHMRSAPVGFEPRGLLTLQVGLTEQRYAKPEQREQFLEQLLPRLEQLPGVERVGAMSRLPLGGSYQSLRYNVGGRPLLPPAERPSADFRLVSPGALEALGARPVSGRLFGAGDRSGAALVVLVNEAFAKAVFPGEDALGKQLLFGEKNVPHTIVGVVSDLRSRQLHAPPQPQMLRPLAQAMADEQTVSLVLRARQGDPLALVPQVRAMLAEVDPELPASQVRTYARVIDDAIVGERVSGRLLSAFALVALVLAAVGVYGVVSYSVSERTYEIGVRMALGARAGEVRRQVLGGSLRMAGLGVVLGTVAALGLAHLISSVLFGVSPRDPLTYAVIAGVLLTVAVAAAYGPARRATRVDPAVALRAP